MTKMDGKTKGTISEQVIITDLLKKGYSVSKPVGDNDRYDLILDANNNLIRLQVKTARVDETGSIAFSCKSTYKLSGENVSRSYTSDEIDAYGVYCPETEDIAYVDIEQAPKSEMRLREDDPQNQSNLISDHNIEGLLE